SRNFVRQASSGAGGHAPLSPTATPPAGSDSTCWRTRVALSAILSAVTLERICFYALTGNLVLFLNKEPFLWESYHAMNALFLFYGVTYLMSIVGGWVSDSWLGRFKTMVVCYVIYLCGYLALPFLAEDSDNDDPLRAGRGRGHNRTTPLRIPAICGRGATHARADSGDDNPFSDPCAWLVYTSLVVIAMGSGALRANMCPFGSDQVGLLSYTMCMGPWWSSRWANMCPFGSDQVGHLSYTMFMISWFLHVIGCIGDGSLVVISIGSGRICYTSRAPDGSVLTNVFKILREAFKRWRQRRQIRRSNVSPPPASPSIPDKASIHFLDYAKHQHGGVFHGSLVDDVKKLGMIITVFAVLIPYWIVYFQMQTTFFFQGLHMRLDFHKSYSVPWVNVSTDLLSDTSYMFRNTTNADRPQVRMVVIQIPFHIILVFRSKYSNFFNFKKNLFDGQIESNVHLYFCTLYHTNKMSHANHNFLSLLLQRPAGTKYDAADMSVFWQIPQFALIGMSEVFTSVACLQFAVSVSPKSMKGLITGIFYCFCGLGSFLGTSILASLAATKTWIYSHNYGNINCRLPCYQVDPPVWRHSCHLDYYFFSLAGLAAFAIVQFLLVARHYGLGSDRLVINAQVQGQVTGGGEGGPRRRTQVQVLPVPGRNGTQAS
ncbi:hypothetical protein EGW08_005969, partial [Elysia chlorotica]